MNLNKDADNSDITTTPTDSSHSTQMPFECHQWVKRLGKMFPGSGASLKGELVIILPSGENRTPQKLGRFSSPPAPAESKIPPQLTQGQYELNGMTLLHAVVRYNPPLDVVAQMIRLCPDMPAAKDCLGRTPLHVAAGSKASASILKLLAHACPAACDVLDAEGKAPLHIVCDSSSVLFKEDRNNENSDTPSQPPNHDAVETLLSYSLHVVTLEDDEDMSPLEHAIMSNASLKTVRMLQSATRKRKQLNDGLRSFIISAKALQVSILSSHASVPSAKKKIRTISVED